LPLTSELRAAEVDKAASAQNVGPE